MAYRLVLWPVGKLCLIALYLPDLWYLIFSSNSHVECWANTIMQRCSPVQAVQVFLWCMNSILLNFGGLKSLPFLGNIRYFERDRACIWFSWMIYGNGQDHGFPKYKLALIMQLVMVSLLVFQLYVKVQQYLT